VLEGIEDEASRSTFLALPMNSAIAGAVESGIWQP